MKIPKKPIASPEALDAFISGAKAETANIKAEAVVTKKRREKEIVTRQTFVMNKALVERLEAYCWWERTSKKATLEEALKRFFKGKEIQPKPI